MKGKGYGQPAVQNGNTCHRGQGFFNLLFFENSRTFFKSLRHLSEQTIKCAVPEKDLVQSGMRRISIIVVMMCSIIATCAQTLKTDDGKMHWEGSFLAGLNTDGYLFDFGVAYYPIQYVGIKAALGADGEIEELGDWGKDELETHHHYAVRFKFTPTLVLRTPRLIHWKSQDAGFYLFAEPGIVLSPGARGSKHAEYFNWDFKGGVNLQIDRILFSIGYGISDFCLYSGYPTNHWGMPDNDKYLTHSVFISISYKF